jgi:hypothetical protein
MTEKELEAKIYDTYYDENPEGDARTNGLWKAVIDANNSDDVEEALYAILNAVKCNHY